MKKVIKILASSFLTTTVLTATVITPIEVIKHNNNNQMTVSNVNNNKSIIKNNMNMNSVLSNIPESKVDNVVNNWFQTTSSKNNAIFLQENLNANKDRIIINKAKKIVNELYTNKISLSSLRQEVKNWFNSLKPEQKAYIKEKIAEENKKQQISIKPLMFSYPTVLLSQTQSYENQLNTVCQNSQDILNKSNKLKALAITLTTFASAATVIAAVEVGIFIVGWVEAAFTTAAVAADWTAVYLAWQTYHSALDPVQNLFAAASALVSAGEVFTFDAYHDIVDEAEGVVKNIANHAKNFMASLYGALASNDADIWADPANAGAVAAINATFVVIDYISTAIDIMMSALGIADMVISLQN